MSRFSTSVLVMLVGLCAGSAGAVTIVSNLANSDDGNASPQSTFWLAQKFTTDANQYEATTLTFRGARNAAQTLAVEIYAHDSGNDTPVTGASGFGSFDATGVTSTLGLQVLPANGTITLQPSTSYWIVLKPSDVNTALWTQTTDLSNTGSGVVVHRRASSNNSGASWSGSAPGSNLKIAVEADVVPVELMLFTVD